MEGRKRERGIKKKRETQTAWTRLQKETWEVFYHMTLSLFLPKQLFVLGVVRCHDTPHLQGPVWSCHEWSKEERDREWAERAQAGLNHSHPNMYTHTQHIPCRLLNFIATMQNLSVKVSLGDLLCVYNYLGLWNEFLLSSSWKLWTFLQMTGLRFVLEVWGIQGEKER